MVSPNSSINSTSPLPTDRYQLLVTNLPSSAVMMFDHDLRFVLADGPELVRNGTSKGALEGKLLSEAVDPAFAVLVEPNLRAALSGRSFQAELPFGDLMYHYTYEPMCAADGSVQYALVVAQDVTPLRQAEKQAVEAEARIREVVGNLPGIVFAIGADRRFRFSDGMALNRLGLRPGEVVGRSVDEMYSNNHEVLRCLDLALSGQRVVADVPVGELIWETRYSPIKGPDGIVVEVVGLSFDVTEQRRSENSNRQSQKLEALGRLAGGVAHDFNNMLTVIIGAAQELGLELKAEPHMVGLASTILSAADRAAKLTRQLLMLARNAPAEASPVFVDAVVQESVGLLTRSIDRRVRITTKLGAGSAVAVVDAGQLQNSIINLGLNARDAMPGGGDLMISTDIVEIDSSMDNGLCSSLLPGTYVRISVTDSGLGIAPDIISRVFDPFFTTKDVGKGTGLGLAMVYGTARAHGGTVTVDSEPGHGSTFQILLPVAPGASPEMTESQRAVSPGTGLVLLIEDEPLVRQTGQKLLASLGYEVVSARDGAEGLRKFNALHNNLVAVLCDVVMPGISGPDAVRLMKESDPDVPVVMCSGYASTHLGQVTKIGDLEVIAKPYSREDLGVILNRLARQL